MRLPIQKLDPKATLPTRAHPDDAGLDLYLLEDAVITVDGMSMLRTGVALELPQGSVGIIADRSSLAKKGLKTAGGVIDAGYRGEVQVIAWNLSREEIHLKAGERCAQLVIYPCWTPQPIDAETLQASTRGGGGFGSTGR